jgi:hypothetical protein
MSERLDDEDVAADRVRVDARVRVYPGTDTEAGGVVVDDYGEISGHAVRVGEQQFAGPARRWAVRLDAGGLVFVDSGDLTAE